MPRTRRASKSRTHGLELDAEVMRYLALFAPYEPILEMLAEHFAGRVTERSEWFLLIAGDRIEAKLKSAFERKESAL